MCLFFIVQARNKKPFTNLRSIMRNINWSFFCVCTKTDPIICDVKCENFSANNLEAATQRMIKVTENSLICLNNNYDFWSSKKPKSCSEWLIQFDDWQQNFEFTSRKWPLLPWAKKTNTQQIEIFLRRLFYWNRSGNVFFFCAWTQNVPLFCVHLLNHQWIVDGFVCSQWNPVEMKDDKITISNESIHYV